MRREREEGEGRVGEGGGKEENVTFANNFNPS